jgi:hypothetical protein
MLKSEVKFALNLKRFERQRNWFNVIDIAYCIVYQFPETVPVNVGEINSANLN